MQKGNSRASGFTATRASKTETGMATMKHGALDSVGMPPMTMAFKAKDTAMVKQAKEGDKVQGVRRRSQRHADHRKARKAVLMQS